MTCRWCATILEIQATNFALWQEVMTSEDGDAIANERLSNLCNTFLRAIHELCDEMVDDDLTKRTLIKITGGHHKEQIGSMAGTMQDRLLLQVHGLSKAIVQIGDEFHVIELKYIHELSTEEQILLGLI